MNNVISINNDYSFLVSEDDNLKKLLWKSLRYRDRGYFHSRLYKQKKWDGFIDFFNRETGKFLTGLLPEVANAMTELKIPYTLKDQRNNVPFRVASVDADFLNQWLPASGWWPDGNAAKPLQLYDYQIDYINKAIRHKRGIVFAPTSSGKTNIMVGILKALQDGVPTLVLANAKSLCDQNYEAIKKWGLTNVGRVYDQYFEPSVVTVATVQSIHKIDKLLKLFRVLIVDEIHVMMTKTCKAAYRKMKQASVRIALSATPFKFGGEDKVQKFYVKGYFGAVFKTKAENAEDGILKTKVLQDRGVLAKSHCTFYPITEPPLPYDIYEDAVTNGIAESEYLHEVIRRLCATLKGRTLILVERLAHGDALAEIIPGSLWVKGEDNLKTRKSVIKQLQDAKGNVVAVATQGIFNTGINVFIHSLINAAGGQAEHQIIQRMGRGLRTADDKERLNYFDFLFLINDYLEKHSRKRIRILQEEGHDLIVKKEIDF